MKVKIKLEAIPGDSTILIHVRVDGKARDLDVRQTVVGKITTSILRVDEKEIGANTAGYVICLSRRNTPIPNIAALICALIDANNELLVKYPKVEKEFTVEG